MEVYFTFRVDGYFKESISNRQQDIYILDLQQPRSHYNQARLYERPDLRYNQSQDL